MDEKEITRVDYPCECGHMHVQHYAFKGHPATGEVESVKRFARNGVYGLINCADGQFVYFSDYEAIVRQLTELRAENTASDAVETAIILLLDKAGVPNSSPIEGERHSRFMTTRLRVQHLISALSQAQAKVEELTARLKYATHFFDSPASFSNGEFALVAEKVYGDGTKYVGKCPHLDERCAAESQLQQVREELEKPLVDAWIARVKGIVK